MLTVIPYKVSALAQARAFPNYGILHVLCFGIWVWGSKRPARKHSAKIGVNHIKLEGHSYFEWADYLDERLLSMYSLYEGEGEIARGFHNLTINDNDIMLRFQYGMYNPDFPSPIRKKLFILDYDAFYDGLQDIEDIKANIDIFHERIEALFENNIKDELRNLMEPMKNEE